MVVVPATVDSSAKMLRKLLVLLLLFKCAWGWFGASRFLQKADCLGEKMYVDPLGFGTEAFGTVKVLLLLLGCLPGHFLLVFIPPEEPVVLSNHIQVGLVFLP